ncbi:hypothetical protein BKN38_09865 [Helicobacter sp. CLO-3]|uniref:hypothetical protein n=1 Tax=unclassified Helicobacter TaxID=2593540 RepID=UPI0008048558|nr:MULTISPECIES: hypothetical protein [unclassified Helicobacter]OBV28587.1 hypothetical protein BA723_08780 [Helicobacter sp. CLO-3]OHU81035.1 hypothetical protein BKN38_09865 [Helicobacter sp. CLO-3]
MISKILVGKAIEELKKLLIGLGLDPDQAIEFLKNLDMEQLKLAWNYKELKVDTYSFRDAIEWIKSEMDQNKHKYNGAVINKTEENGKIILTICLLDKKDEPMLKLGDAFCKVETLSICDDLRANFGDKNMCIIK